MTIGALGHVAIHFKQFEVGLALGEARRKRIRLMEQRAQLGVELGVLKDPKRVLAIAQEKIGLRTPRTDDIVALEKLGQPRPTPPAVTKTRRVRRHPVKRVLP